MVDQRNSDSGLVEQRWWNSGTDIVDQWNNDGVTVMVEQRNNYGVTVQQRWWTSGTMTVEEWNRYGRTVQQ